MSNWLEAFTIFERNGLGDHDLGAGHDVIYVHLSNILTNSPDGLALQELGWFKDSLEEDEAGETITYDEDSSWQRFV